MLKLWDVIWKSNWCLVNEISFFIISTQRIPLDQSNGILHSALFPCVDKPIALTIGTPGILTVSTFGTPGNPSVHCLVLCFELYL